MPGNERLEMADVGFHPEAAAGFEEALCWYAERSERAAQGFEAAVSDTLHDIEAARTVVRHLMAGGPNAVLHGEIEAIPEGSLGRAQIISLAVP